VTATSDHTTEVPDGARIEPGPSTGAVAGSNSLPAPPNPPFPPPGATPPAAWPPGSEPSAPRPKRRWRWWLLLLVPVVLIPAGYLALAFHEACCTHDLLEADFEAESGPFKTDENDNFIADLHEGTYRMTAKNDLPTHLFAFAWLARPTITLASEVSIVEPGTGEVGIASVEADVPDLRSGFAIIIGQGDASLIELRAWDQSDFGFSVGLLDAARNEAMIERTPMVALRSGQRLGLTCALGELTAYVDGQVAMTASYGQGSMRFDRMALFFNPGGTGDIAQFDDVDAHLP